MALFKSHHFVIIIKFNFKNSDKERYCNNYKNSTFDYS